MSFFGLDIGSHRLKAVQLASEKGDKYRLIALGSGPSTTKGLESDSEADLTALAQQIKKIHRAANFKTKNTAVALPEDKVFSRLLIMPKLSGEELNSALKWEAEQYIPLPLQEVSLTHQVVGVIKKGATEKIKILLVAAPQRLISKIMTVLKTADLNVVSIETEMASLCRSLIEAKDEAILVVDFGAKATDLAITENGQIIFTRSVPTGGEALTRAVATALGLESGQAEEYKKAYGVDPLKLEGKVKQALEPLLDRMAEEMKKAMEFYQAETESQKQISRAVLAGGSASLPEVVGLLATKLNVEVQRGDPFVNIVRDETVQKVPLDEASLFGVAMGLAMKKII